MVCQQRAGQTIECFTQAFHVSWSLSMRTLTLRVACHGFRVHQKSWGAALAQSCRHWCFRWARHSERKALRDLADNPHLLADIGVTREEALEEAGRSIFELRDVDLHSL
jgi:uncharacterized protein YjiS (DUF1127 family)